MDESFHLLVAAGHALIVALHALALPLLVFAALAVVVKGRQAFGDARRALPESRTTLVLVGVNAVLVMPLIALASTAMHRLIDGNGLALLPAGSWHGLPTLLVIVVAIFVGDFVGYWRHRFEHCPLLWPAHAVHHSDTAMTWLALERFHPINRLTTFVIDNAVLLLLGMPDWAVVANNLVRHWYGFLIHADLPWTYGWLGRVFVSPAMHRWHHAADVRAFDTNYATVFSLFDQLFGTFRVPGPCDVALGVTDDMGVGAVGQLAYPFRRRGYRPLWRRLQRRLAAGPWRRSSGL